MKVAIIGAGVLGRLISLKLIADGHAVTLIERHRLNHPTSCAAVSAGMLCPLSEAIHAPEAVLQMGWQSQSQWPVILDGLRTVDPLKAPIFFQQHGSLTVAFDQDRSSFHQWRQNMSRHRNVSSDQIDWLDAPALLNLEPGLSAFSQGALLKSEGQLCNRQFLESSNRVLKQRVRVIEQQPVGKEHLSDLQSTYDWVFDCRGHGALGSGWQPAHKHLRGVRGEVTRVHCSQVRLSHPVRVLHPKQSIYIVPKPGDEFVVGATEIESHSEHPITVRSTLELLSTLYCVHPAFAEASVLESQVGIRCAYPDNQPKVHRTGNLISANGSYRHGWLTGPALADRALAAMKEAWNADHH